MDWSTLVFALAIGLLLLIVAYPLLWLLMSAFGLPGEFQLGYLIACLHADPESRAAGQHADPGASAPESSASRSACRWPGRRREATFHCAVLSRRWSRVAYITPPYLTAIAYIILLGPDAGLFQSCTPRQLTGGTHGPIDIFSMGGVIFVIGMHVFPFTYFMTYTALRSVDASYEEAAQSSRRRGAGACCSEINLPLVAPAITGGALLSAIDSMALFGPQAFLGLPAQITFLPTRIYGVIGSYPAALGGGLGAVADACRSHCLRPAAPARLSRAALLHHRRWPRPPRRDDPPRRVEVGYCSRSASASSSSAAIAPVGVLAIAAFSRSWVDGFSLGELHAGKFRRGDVQQSDRGARHPQQLSARDGRGVCAVIVGATVAYVDLRTQARGRRLLDYLAVLPLGLPGTVMAVGVLLAFIRPPIRDIRHDLDPARRLRRALRAARHAQRQFDAAPDRPLARGGGAHCRRVAAGGALAHPAAARAARAGGRLPARLHPGA